MYWGDQVGGYELANTMSELQSSCIPCVPGQVNNSCSRQHSTRTIMAQGKKWLHDHVEAVMPVIWKANVPEPSAPLTTIRVQFYSDNGYYQPSWSRGTAH